MLGCDDPDDALAEVEAVAVWDVAEADVDAVPLPVVDDHFQVQPPPPVVAKADEKAEEDPLCAKAAVGIALKAAKPTAMTPARAKALVRELYIIVTH